MAVSVRERSLESSFDPDKADGFSGPLHRHKSASSRMNLRPGRSYLQPNQ